MDLVHPLTFGVLLRRHRRATGLSQEALAERASISRRSISDMERGLPHRPRHETVTLLAEALHLSPPEHEELLTAAVRLRTRPSPVGADRNIPSASAARADLPLVGRTDEMDLLERHLAGEGPALLLLAGEPGIGKTHLLQAAIVRARAEGLSVLEGGCQRRGGQEPYAPVLEALQRHIRGQRPDRLRADLQGCAWLVRLLPELAAGPIPPLPAWTLTPEQERRLTSDAVVRFLTNVAGPSGTVLVLDDLQWAGPDALDLLATLSRSAAQVPLRLLGAYRDTELRAHEPLAVLLADLGHAGLAARRLLTPLSAEEAGHLLDGLLEGVRDVEAVRARVLKRAGGMPFFLVSCVQAARLDEEGAEGPMAIPWTVAEGLQQRLAGAPRGGAAVSGHRGGGRRCRAVGSAAGRHHMFRSGDGGRPGGCVPCASAGGGG